MNFDEKTDTRLREEEIAKIDKIVKAKRDLYTNRSHFVRAAIIRLIRQEEGENEIKQ